MNKAKIKEKAKLTGIYFWNRKGLSTLIIFVLVLLITFFALLPELLNTYRQNDEVTYYSHRYGIIYRNDDTNNDIVPGDFISDISRDYTISTYSANADKNYYFSVSDETKEYYSFFKDIRDTEWPLFNFFKLGNYWKDKWTDEGPIEATANQTDTSGANTNIVSQITLNSNSQFYTEERTAITKFISGIVNISNDSFLLGDYPSAIQDTQLKKLYIISNSTSVRTLNNDNLSRKFDDFDSAPFVLRINNGSVYILNNLVTQAELSSSGT